MLTILILIPTLCFVAVILFLRNGLYRLDVNENANTCTNTCSNTYTNANDNAPPAPPNANKFSVVIAARNEERNIAACLETVFAQDGVPPDSFEVIVVNDRSEDATADILRGLENQYENLKVIAITETPPGISPKKHAVSKGIEAASHEIIVFTDADCRVPPRWIATLGGYFDEDAALVQGITSYGYIDGMGKLFFGAQSVDFLSHGIIAAAAIGAGLPINANANNMAFRKRAFEEVGGYGAESGVALGDDDHLLQRVWRAGRRVRFMADPRGAVETAPTETLRALFEQRRRWGSVTVHYGARQVALLSAVFMFYLTIPLTLAASIFDPAMLRVCAALLLVKLAGEMALMIPGTRLFGKQRLRKYIVPASLVQLPMTLAAVASGVFGRFTWKGQEMARAVKAVKT